MNRLKEMCSLFIVMLCLISCSSTPSPSANTPPTPTPTSYGTPDLSAPGNPMPTMACSDAVQQIGQNQISYILIYKERNPEPGIPVNSIVGIEVIPRSAGAVPTNPQASPDQIDIETRYPDQDCYPQVLAAVKQENQHLLKSEQIQVDWYYTLT